MKKIFCGILIFLVILSSCVSSRQYKPINDIENIYYVNVNKNIWPDDLRENGIENYYDEFIGWVGIVEKYVIENNGVQFTMKHHYYDWIEDFGYSKGPFLLSPDGEGYIVGNYALRPDVISEFIQDFIGDCVIIYGYPKEILENGEIIIDTEYARRISKRYVDPNWIAPGFKKYGRNGLE